MLVTIGIGASYGSGFEYADENLPQNTLQNYVQHPTHLKLKPGMYTDDTQMSIAIAEAIVENIPWTREALCEKFFQAFKRDWRDGYSRGFQGLLETSKSSQELLSRLDGDSDKSGGAMRATPIGAFKDAHTVMTKAAIQASVTHNTVHGRAAAQAAALMSHYFMYKVGPKRELAEYVDNWISSTGVASCNFSVPWAGRVGPKGIITVRAAMTAIIARSKMSDILRSCVYFSGDTDTVAAIAMGAAFWSEEVEQDLPDVLRYKLENGKYGREYLEKLDQKLVSFLSEQKSKKS